MASASDDELRAGASAVRDGVRRFVLVGSLLLTVLTGCTVQVLDPDAIPRDAAPSATPSPAPTPAAAATAPAATAGPPSIPEAGTALAALATVPVKGRAPMTGYDRAQFGQPWLDTDRNGCDTRNDVLGSTLRTPAHRPGTNGCVVTTGTLDDPYTGRVIGFVRGDGSLVDIDHVVALGNAWATGAQLWPIGKRAALANDPLNLLAVDAGANRQKGDGDTATWLPPAKRFRCPYVARQVAVKTKYELWVTAAEGAAMRRVLSSCPGQPLPVDSGAPTLAPVRVPTPTPSPAPARPSTGPARARVGSGVRFDNCDAARAASAAPVRLGDPGYGRHLDRDGDGVGCE